MHIHGAQSGVKELVTNESFLSSADASPWCSSAGAQSAADESVKTTEITDHADDHAEYEHSDTTYHADTHDDNVFVQDDGKSVHQPPDDGNDVHEPHHDGNLVYQPQLFANRLEDNLDQQDVDIWIYQILIVIIVASVDPIRNLSVMIVVIFHHQIIRTPD